jgi:hypothetical protein
VQPVPERLTDEIEASRLEIEKLQARVRQLVSRRGKRAELVKSAQVMGGAEPTEVPEIKGKGEFVTEKVLTMDEGAAAFKHTRMSDIRLIAFHHGNVVFLLADEKTITVKMDERGPKPLFDLLTANEVKPAGGARSAVAAIEARPN